MNDQSIAEAATTCKYTPNTRGKHSCSQWDSNLQSQQTSGFRPTPQKARPLKSAYVA